ncbi:VanZ family protein [Thiolinea disciformis]|uniref:VanZ family protein n=1 Tax=Thiolinea disciformis TaxID=125614 RepID=UPI000363F607|nr:VanZ family protein [Thiolinea disciformis]
MFKSLFQRSSTQQRYLKILFVVLLLLGLVAALMPTEDLPKANDKMMHTFAFFGFAALLDMASNRNFLRFQVPILLGYGILIECLQYFTTWRSFSVADFVADALGVLLYWLLFRAILQVKPRYA